MVKVLNSLGLLFWRLGFFSERRAQVKNKYGFINTAGEVVIQPQFDDAEAFSEGVALVVQIFDDNA